MGIKLSLLSNKERNAFKGLTMLGLLATGVGLGALAAKPDIENRILFLGIGAAGFVLATFQVWRISDYVWGLDLAREAMRAKSEEDQGRANWAKYQMRTVPFRHLGKLRQGVILLLWVVGVGCGIWALATAFGLEGTQPSAFYTERYLRNDPAMVIFDRVLVAGIAGLMSFMLILGGTFMFRTKIEKKPDDDGWDDIIFIKDKSDIVH